MVGVALCTWALSQKRGGLNGGLTPDSMTVGTSATLNDEPLVVYAGFRQRCGAVVIDIALIWAGMLLAGFVAGFIIALIDRDAPSASESQLLRDVTTGIFVVALFVAGAYFWIGNSLGGTLGKRAVGIRVVSRYNHRSNIRLGRGLERYLIQVLGSFPPFLGWFWCIWDDKKQTWHDHVGDSVVILAARR